MGGGQVGKRFCWRYQPESVPPISLYMGDVRAYHIPLNSTAGWYVRKTARRHVDIRGTVLVDGGGDSREELWT